MAKYTPQEYELFRRRCAQLKEEGWKQATIAQALGFTEGWVSTTLKKYRQQGSSGLQRRKPPGSSAKLTAEQLQELVEELRKGATHHGFAGEIWTRQRVSKLIEQLFGISYEQTQVGRILHKLGWSPQKPSRKARQQDTQQVKTWQEERLPELKKSPAGAAGDPLH